MRRLEMKGGKNDVEQRQVTRRHLVFYLRVFDGMSSRVVGHLMDISSNGLMLLSDEPVPVNEEYRLRMRLPTEVVGSDEIIFGAIGRWCRQDENPDFYITGFKIQDMDDETEKSVSQLIEEFGFLD
ncbi:MAG TPA: PilZ domain-containing protein [Desulfobacterales bacterium]|nr:PilZ domain-containing protein [Desulfobacterales bacterium]HIP39585.1 PilZ domain-containing protein [Desulfocapsa sulfexigens]